MFVSDTRPELKWTISACRIGNSVHIGQFHGFLGSANVLNRIAVGSEVDWSKLFCPFNGPGWGGLCVLVPSLVTGFPCSVADRESYLFSSCDFKTQTLKVRDNSCDLSQFLYDFQQGFRYLNKNASVDREAFF